MRSYFSYILWNVSHNNGLLYKESRGFLSSRVVGHPLLCSHGWRHTKCVLRQIITCCAWSTLKKIYQMITESPISVKWTHFAGVASRSALLPAAVLPPCSLLVLLSSFSLLRERLRLWKAQWGSLWVLVQRGRGTGRRVQEPANGWMVQHGRVTFLRVLGYREKIISCGSMTFCVKTSYCTSGSFVIPALA